MRELFKSLLHWAQDVGRWWWAAVVGLVLGGVSLGTTVYQFRRYLPWLLTAVFAVALAGSFLAYHRERQRRLDSHPTRPEVTPPGGGMPHIAPVSYQVDALRQVIAKLAETLDQFSYMNLDAVLRNHQRTGTDPVYEPLGATACDEGLARLVELGELEGSPWQWKITPKGVDPAAPARERIGQRVPTTAVPASIP